jgi:hypothetical protein
VQLNCLMCFFEQHTCSHFWFFNDPIFSPCYVPEHFLSKLKLCTLKQEIQSLLFRTSSISSPKTVKSWRDQTNTYINSTRNSSLLFTVYKIHKCMSKVVLIQCIIQQFMRYINLKMWSLNLLEEIYIYTYVYDTRIYILFTLGNLFTFGIRLWQNYWIKINKKKYIRIMEAQLRSHFKSVTIIKSSNSKITRNIRKVLIQNSWTVIIT